MKKKKRNDFKVDRDKRYYYECTCSCALLQTSVDGFEFDDGVFVPAHVNMQIYKQSSWYGIKDRLRHIWHIIRYGDPWRDQIILEMTTAECLAHDLLEQVNIVKERNKEK